MALSSRFQLLQLETERLDLELKELISRLERSQAATVSHQTAAYGLACEAVENASTGMLIFFTGGLGILVYSNYWYCGTFLYSRD